MFQKRTCHSSEIESNSTKTILTSAVASLNGLSPLSPRKITEFPEHISFIVGFFQFYPPIFLIRLRRWIKTDYKTRKKQKTRRFILHCYNTCISEKKHTTRYSYWSVLKQYTRIQHLETHSTVSVGSDSSLWFIQREPVFTHKYTCVLICCRVALCWFVIRSSLWLFIFCTHGTIISFIHASFLPAQLQNAKEEWCVGSGLWFHLLDACAAFVCRQQYRVDAFLYTKNHVNDIERYGSL